MDNSSTNENISGAAMSDRSNFFRESFSLNFKFKDLFQVVDGKVEKRKDFKEGFLKFFRKAAVYPCVLNFKYARVNKRSANIMCYCSKNRKNKEVGNMGNCMTYQISIKFDPNRKLITEVLIRPRGTLKHGTVSTPIPKHRQVWGTNGDVKRKLKHKKTATFSPRQLEKTKRESPELFIEYITFGEENDLSSDTRMREFVACMLDAKYEDTNEFAYSVVDIIDIVEFWQYQKEQLLKPPHEQDLHEGITVKIKKIREV
ncbi:uncharacterized protein LOC113389326 [Ctenocephalides felis]|uniref:uncharacterized protein LOC113389326 n=1 Tax=Ctenocephalides felis TaxID=7515 RepID=UPI000E6E54D2|nr:uncharacterized protein LOC113389326 [Ctenocephalides felis]